jgi:hypothetical protein
LCCYSKCSHFHVLSLIVLKSPDNKKKARQFSTMDFSASMDDDDDEVDVMPDM